MVLYITDPGHEDALDHLDPQKRVVERQDMRLLFRKELPYLGAVSHIVVEEAAVDMESWELAAEGLKSARDIPVLLFVDRPGQNDTFVRMGSYDILNRAAHDVTEELQDWLDGRFDDLAHTWIAVAGLTPGCGATALALHLAAYIHAQGQDVAVTECNDAFPALSAAYGWAETAPDSYAYGGILYYQNQIDESSPYTIFDLGVLEQKRYSVWKQCPVKILVADGKPYHLTRLSDMLTQVADYPGKIILAFNFVPEAEKGVLRQKYETDNVRVWFVPIQPELFLSSGEYQELVDGYVTPLASEKTPKKVIPFRLPKIPKKNAIAGCILLLAAGAGFGLNAMLHAQAERTDTVVMVEQRPRMDFTATTRIRLMLAREAAEPEAAEEAPEEVAEETEPEADVSFAASDVTQPSASVDDIPGSNASTQEPALEAAEPGTEEPSQQLPQQIAVPVAPSLSGYQGQIYTGSQVVTIMNKFAGQPVAMHLVTRSTEGWYNYSVSGSGLAAAAPVSSGVGLVDPQCSFLCQVLRTADGEAVGLEFIQQ